MVCLCFRWSIPVVGPRHRRRHFTLRLNLHYLQVLPQILRVNMHSSPLSWLFSLHSCLVEFIMWNLFEIRWISWIHLEPVEHHWTQLKFFFASLTRSWLFSLMVSLLGCWSVGWKFKAHSSLFFNFNFFCQLSWTRWIFWYSNIRTAVPRTQLFYKRFYFKVSMWNVDERITI